jgi:AcrR family transcriptional regulator
MVPVTCKATTTETKTIAMTTAATFIQRGTPGSASLSWWRGGSAIKLEGRHFSRHSVTILTNCHDIASTYTSPVPRLWNATIEAHRREVRDAIVDTTAALVAEHGLLSVTMSQIAEAVGIGRATLYKYFSDVETILLAWHERQIARHLDHLADVRDETAEAGERLEAVLEAYALILYESRGHHDTELAGLLHRDEQVAQAHQKLHAMIRDLLAEAKERGHIRIDIAPDELANYCLYSLAAASSLSSTVAVRRLVTITLDGLRAT